MALFGWIHLRHKKSLQEAGLQHARGVGQIEKSSGNQGVVLQGGAKSGALSGGSAPIDPDFAYVVNHWPDVPALVRKNILAMIRAAGVGWPEF
jgi:hypothetical protein